MKKLLTSLAILALVASPALAREYTPWAGVPTGGSDAEADVVLEYDGDAYFGYGTSPNWTDLTVVNFAAPAGGPWTLCEWIGYVTGPNPKDAQVWAVGNLSSPPVLVIADTESFLPFGPGPWPPGGYSVVDITSYGLVYDAGDLFGIGTWFDGQGDGIGLAYAYDDANPGHSWAIYAGFWTDDTYGYGVDDGLRAGLCGGPTATEQTTWGGVKALYNK
jgi:hypothetical protein